MSEQTRLPSYEELRRTGNRPWPTPEADRIFWTMNGPLHSSVSIISHGSLKPYAQQTDESNPTWHPISQCPLTEPKISSITVEVDELYRWEDEWLSFHLRHADPDPRWYGNGARFGPLPDYDPNSDEESLSEERPLHLLECCTPRPRHVKSSVVVNPSPGNEFITIHDYLSTVHEFLLASRENILAAWNVLESVSLPAETKLLVNYDGLDNLMILLEHEDWDRWRSSFRRKRPSHLADDD
ncbi:hypothetical protein HD806DRAFT_379174 [Xylariaceae sp. AK1471]|nr:hypothetical protein HD806DRAFT_379174 [Xylariaceae sp. AK1471]